MSSAAVTPQMRAHGWNVYFLADTDAFHFSGIFQSPEDGFLTFRDVVDELRLCFELPDAVRHDDSQTQEKDPWNDIAFGLVTRDTSLSDSPRLVTDEHRDMQVPSLAGPEAQERAVVRYHLVRHSPPCNLPSDAPLNAHLKARCAIHIARPTRRPDPRYLPPKKPSADPRIATMPFRRTIKARTSSQSPKRRASGSASPNKQQDEEDVASMVAPPNMEEINHDYARQIMAQFRASCLVMANRCAISGKGRSWCMTPAVGPGLQACHIISQQHYHLYPGPRHDQTTEFSGRRLREAWMQTWSATNGLLLLSHLHEAFDSRLFSIHPDTLVIRAFVPYDIFIDYHGTTARVPPDVDRNALRYHYNMCCIENMAAKMPFEDLILPPYKSQAATSGTNTPLSLRGDFPVTPRPDGPSSGDPTKRSQSATDCPGPDRGPPSSQVYGQSFVDSFDMDVRGCKRRRIEGYKVDTSDVYRAGWTRQGTSKSYMTPAFLADVNWELRKLAS
ncbi:hypothetical protein FANTH_14741 [Fusarium anthophilum]|uniref:HNH nuclease domain-containing protein n=1 Tax=Fusarium anthophilum TaxID=48485 RepID=A0A8H4YG64_9HYPO|nr:hypothetical protein FANTH_14741 [Fusarium anthophilum]